MRKVDRADENHVKLLLSFLNVDIQVVYEIGTIYKMYYSNRFTLFVIR